MSRILSVTYDGVKVLDNVSMNVEEGEMIGIIGRSGAGKTSLTSILPGNLEPTGGVVSGLAKTG